MKTSAVDRKGKKCRELRFSPLPKPNVHRNKENGSFENTPSQSISKLSENRKVKCNAQKHKMVWGNHLCRTIILADLLQRLQVDCRLTSFQANEVIFWYKLDGKVQSE